MQGANQHRQSKSNLVETNPADDTAQQYTIQND